MMRRARAAWRRAAWRRAAWTGAGAAGLGALVCVCVFLAVAGPRADLALRTSALRADLRTAAQTITGSTGYAGFTADSPAQFGAASITSAQAELQAHLRQEDFPLTPSSTDFSGISGGFYPVAGAASDLYTSAGLFGAITPQLELVYQDQLGSHARLAAGRLPGAASVTGGQTTLQAAVTSATAARFAVRPGSRLRLSPQVTVLITGVIAPVAPRSSFWTTDPVAVAPVQKLVNPNLPLEWQGAAFIAPDEVRLLPELFSSAVFNLYWVFPLDLRHVTAPQAPALAAALTQASYTAGHLSQGLPVTVQSGLSSVLAAFESQDDAVGDVAAMLSLSLAVVTVVTVLLGGMLLAASRREEFAVLHARGASRRQVALAALRAGALVSVPAAALGGALAIALTPVASAPLSWWLGAAVLAAALIGPPAAAVRSLRAGRGPAPLARLAAEAGLVAAAVGGLILLRHQVQPPAGGADTYTSAAAVLVAIPAAILVMRCYPMIVRSLLRLARMRRGVAAFAGLASAARASAVAVLPVFALVLALTVVAFGAMVQAAMRRGEVASSWQETGADVQINAVQAPGALSPDAQRAILAMPGVRAAVTVTLVPAQAPRGQVAVAVIDPARYAALLDRTPLPRFPAAALARPAVRDSPVPALVSSSAQAVLGSGTARLDLGGQQLTIRPAGMVPAIPGVPAGAIVVPAWAVRITKPFADVMLLVGPGFGAHARQKIEGIVPGTAVTLRSAVLQTLTSAPLTRAAYDGFIAGAAAAAALSLLVVLLALMLGARGRRLTLARLRTMGLAPRQATWLILAEVLPLVLAGIIGGVASALVLGPLTGPGIDLAAFTGSRAAVAIRAEPLPLAGAAGGLLALIALMVVSQAVMAGRRTEAVSLREQMARE